MDHIKPTLVILLIGILGAGLFAWSGLYDPSSDNPHWKITSFLIEAIRDRAVAHHASDEILAVDLNDPQLILNGAVHYDEMCVDCHLAPGMKDTELRAGLYPQPPRLSEVKVDPTEAFWVIKHGLKMTAMPAWGPTHNDVKIWGLVAFVRKLHGMTPEKYKEVIASALADEEMKPNKAAHTPAPVGQIPMGQTHAGK